MNYYHGGDIYSNNVTLDFSVNINPLGMPETAREAAIKGIQLSDRYPDFEQRELKDALAQYLGVSKEDILFGNGAADLIYRLMMVLKPGKVLVPAPSFSEYRSAAVKAGAEVRDFFLREEESFNFTEEVTEEFIQRIGDLPEGSAVFLCNPNNPDGGLIMKDKLARIHDVCEKNSVWLIVDECFLPFFSEEKRYSMLRRKRAKEEHVTHLVVLRAFTKIFGMPGLRLGFLVSENHELISKVKETMTPWEINVPAQMAGAAALRDRDFTEKTRQLIKEERSYLVQELRKLHYTEKVYNPDSAANFILMRVGKGAGDLKEKLLEKNILIRSCSDYRGLDERYYRIAVRTHTENVKLIEEMSIL